MSKFVLPLLLLILNKPSQNFAAERPRISMLQEITEIKCQAPKRAGLSFTDFTMDRKEESLTTSSKEVFERVKFLDSAVLMRSKSSPGKYLLFQIMLDGQSYVTEGSLLPFFEKECEDTGASKTCKNEKIEKLFWSPEKLQAKVGGKDYGGSIDTYGFLANHATFFRAGNCTLIDYGSAIDMIVGKTVETSCQ